MSSNNSAKPSTISYLSSYSYSGTGSYSKRITRKCSSVLQPARSTIRYNISIVWICSVLNKKYKAIDKTKSGYTDLFKHTHKINIKNVLLLIKILKSPWLRCGRGATVMTAAAPSWRWTITAFSRLPGAPWNGCASTVEAILVVTCPRTGWCHWARLQNLGSWTATLTIESLTVSDETTATTPTSESRRLGSSAGTVTGSDRTRASRPGCNTLRNNTTVCNSTPHVPCGCAVINVVTRRCRHGPCHSRCWTTMPEYSYLSYNSLHK